VKTGSVSDISVAFNEWSGYRIILSLYPRIDFHSQEGKTLKWGETLSFKVSISSDEKIYFQYEATEKLDHNLGWGFGVVTVPTQIPKGQHMLSIQFTEVGPEFKNIYKEARIVVTKIPLIRFLD